MKRLPVVAIAAIVWTLAGCGDSSELQSEPESTLPETSSSVSVTSSATIAPATSTTSSPTTSTSTSTTTTETPATTTTETPATSPTTTAPVPTGWVVSDLRPAAFEVGYSGNWDGPPSPPAPADPSQPPADGYYVATLRQPWASGDSSLHVTVHRLEYCTVIVGGCDYYDEGTNETNLDPTWSLDVDVPFDATSRVVLSGFSCWDDVGPEQTKLASGADLAELFESFAADYDEAVLPSLLAGMPNYEVAEAVAAEPTGGFVGEAAHCGDEDESGMAGPLRYLHGDAPVLLLQTVTTWADGGEPLPMAPTDLIRLQGVDYRDGIPTFFFYAGFYS